MNMAHFVYPAIANSGQAATAYPAAQPAYVAAAPQAAYATPAPRAGQAYDSYQTAHAQQYAYTTRTPVAVTPAAAYDQSKAYYQPTQAASAYTAAETHYQAAKPAYTTSTYNTNQRQANNQKAPVQVSATPAGAYVYPATTTPAATTYNNPTTYSSTATSSSYSGKTQRYDAALYSAATNYYQQQQAAKAAGGWSGFKKQNTFGQNKQKPKGPPKQPQLHYCDVCKISCAGPQTYREHLDGQKHKKKEQALKLTQPASRGQNQLRCELCDVTCTGTDAYAAHIRGSKHQKVLKLHTKLGKPIPSTEPVVMASNTQATISTAGKSSTNTTNVAARALPKAKPDVPIKKVLATPKITFVGGSQLKTTGAKTEELKEIKSEPSLGTSSTSLDSSKDDDKLDIIDDKDVQPVGFEYIDEVKNDQGKTISFHCKLCECKFNDPNAKEMHMKGRRHRLQYKKKVDPTLLVEVKPSIRVRKVQEEKLRRQAQKEEFWRRREQEGRWRDEMRMEESIYWEERRRYEEEMDYYEWQRRQGRPGPVPPRPFPPMPPSGPGMMRKPDTADDRHVMAKHASIYPNETELQAVQNIVSCCEKALKLVSDHLAESDAPKTMEVDKEKETTDTVKKEGEKEGAKKEEAAAPPRVLKGVMRVGVLAKGLLLHGDLNVNLVVLCADKPTRTLLERVADGLPKQMTSDTEEKYEVKRCVEEAAIIVSTETEPKTSCTITLTSPVMRDSTSAEAAGESVVTKDPPDVLDRQKCLDALAALRHAKWFQARANGLQSCVVVIRILRDLCQRVPTWTPLNEWAMELLVEKCVSSGGSNMSPGDALRRVFECISSGILLPGNPGLYDPCEKEPGDAAASLTNQQREVITSSAQHALRLIAFRQIHKVLGMDLLPTPRFQQRRFNPRKRRRTNSAGEHADDGGEKKEKKEGEEGESTMEAATTQPS